MKRHTGKISLVITLLWVAVIFSFSLQPAGASSQLSLGVGHWLIDLLPSAIKDKLMAMPQEQLEFLHTLLRAYSAKSAHPFQKNGAPFRLKLSSAQPVN